MFFLTKIKDILPEMDRDDILLKNDHDLADLCTVSAFVGSGPGGQHRNRNYTAVRVKLKFAENITAEETSSRSQKQNLEAALNKLRIFIARYWRKEYCGNFVYKHLNENNPEFALELARLLDTAVAAGFDHKKAAEMCGLSNTAFLKELSRIYEVWDEFQESRAQLGLPPLKRPRS